MKILPPRNVKPSHPLCIVAAQGDFLPRIEERVENLLARSDHSDSPSVCKVTLAMA